MKVLMKNATRMWNEREFFYCQRYDNDNFLCAKNLLIDLPSFYMLLNFKFFYWISFCDPFLCHLYTHDSRKKKTLNVDINSEPSQFSAQTNLTFGHIKRMNEKTLCFSSYFCPLPHIYFTFLVWLPDARDTYV